MERFIKLDLRSDSDSTEQANLSQPEQKDSEALAKKLNQIANRAAHKAASEYGHSRGGLFSK
ncbi:MAG: hypothetical protein P4L03_00345 [Terracidiphilus sp.]|nr:hypothetical protein [Terracidiphilus sp.]